MAIMAYFPLPNTNESGTTYDNNYAPAATSPSRATCGTPAGITT